MGRRDWDYVNLPKLLVKRLDQFLETPKAKKMGISSKSELLRHIINEYLDEQEKFYNKLESIDDFIVEIKDRDHLVITFNEESQFEKILYNFVQRGVKNNQINMLFITKEEEQRFTEALRKSGLNIDMMFNSQDVLILPADECLHEGRCYLEPVLNRLSLAKDLAKVKDKSGLNVIGTLPGRLTGQGKYEDALYIENSFHDVIQKFDIPLTVLCLHRSIPASMENRLMECHDLIIKHAVTAQEPGLL